MHNAEILSGYCHNKERKSQKPRVYYEKKKHSRLYLSQAKADLLVPAAIINLTRSHRFSPEFCRVRCFAAWQPVRPYPAKPLAG
jgi:hypothetical protein